MNPDSIQQLDFPNQVSDRHFLLAKHKDSLVVDNSLENSFHRISKLQEGMIRRIAVHNEKSAILGNFNFGMYTRHRFIVIDSKVTFFGSPDSKYCFGHFNTAIVVQVAMLFHP